MTSYDNTTIGGRSNIAKSTIQILEDYRNAHNITNIKMVKSTLLLSPTVPPPPPVDKTAQVQSTPYLSVPICSSSSRKHSYSPPPDVTHQSGAVSQSSAHTAPDLSLLSLSLSRSRGMNEYGQWHRRHRAVQWQSREHRGFRHRSAVVVPMCVRGRHMVVVDRRAIDSFWVSNRRTPCCEISLTERTD